MMRLGRCMRAGLGSLVAGLGWLAVSAGEAEAGPVYLALGDSVTFGVGQNQTESSDGNRGYVANYANYLGQVSGTRPTVINLAVTGETSASFFGTGPNYVDATSTLPTGTAARLNTHYTGGTVPTQDSLLLSTISSQLAQGNTITTVTITLGANDLFLALATGASFADALTAYQANETKLLTQIRQLLPSTNLILVNYYDPYAPYLNATNDPRQPYAQASALGIPLLNSLIAAEAHAFGAGYANVYPLFVGKETVDTYIASGNVHPTPDGYGLIATAVESIPEPASLILVAVGVNLVPVLGRCRCLAQRRSARQATPLGRSGRHRRLGFWAGRQD